jgi:small subunit ribosomal protein S8
MATDQIADLLTRIRNAQTVGHPTVTIPASTSKEAILKLLQKEGYIANVVKENDAKDKPALKVMLKYDDTGRPVIREIKRVSSPGKRVYVSSEQIPKLKGGLGLTIVSTSKGVLSDREARKMGIGGELVCSVF